MFYEEISLTTSISHTNSEISANKIMQITSHAYEPIQESYKIALFILFLLAKLFLIVKSIEKSGLNAKIIARNNCFNK